MEYIKIAVTAYIVISLIVQIWRLISSIKVSKQLTRQLVEFEVVRNSLIDACTQISSLAEGFSKPPLPGYKIAGPPAGEVYDRESRRREVVAVEKVLMENKYVITSERLIAFGHQFKLSGGEIVNVYTTGKVYIGGTQNSALQDLLRPVKK